MRRLTWLVLLLLAALATFAWRWWSRPTPEEQVRRVILRVVAGAEAADPGSILGCIADDYADAEGLDRALLGALVFRELRRRGPVAVHLSPIAVDLELPEGAKGGSPERAVATFEAVLAEDTPHSWWPAEADALSFEVDLVQQDGTWRIVGHLREPLFEVPTTGTDLLAD